MTAGLKTRNCRWIDVRGAVDERGRLNFIEAGKDLPFSRSACSGCTISRRGNGAAGTAIAILGCSWP